MDKRGVCADCVLACVMLVSSGALAQDQGFDAGLRAGYGVPFGKATGAGTRDMNEGITGIVPWWVDVGYRLTPNVFVGAYFQYGIGFVGSGLSDLCDINGVDCSTRSIRLGGQVHYHFVPEGRADPWLGYGFGYEWWNLGVRDPAEQLSTTARGLEFANFQAGLDFYAAPHYLGPFVSFSLDQFDSVDACSGAPGATCTVLGDGEVQEKSLHQWLLFGLRGGFTGFAR